MVLDQPCVQHGCQVKTWLADKKDPIEWFYTPSDQLER